jgi:hypothetical protein
MIIECKCANCSGDIKVIVDEQNQVCHSCMRILLNGSFNETITIKTQRILRWRQIKKITYLVLLTVVPAIIIGYCGSPKLEILYMIGMITGQLITVTVDWLTEKF